MNLPERDALAELSPLEFYDRCVSELRQEDELVNRRMTWLLVSQGVLFGAATGGGLKPDQLDQGYFSAIMIFGVALCVLVIVSLRGAVRAFDHALKSLHDEFGQSKYSGLAFQRLPQVSRNDKHPSLRMGLVSTYGLPILLLLAWVGIAFLRALGVLGQGSMP
jgi:hypothetical protein